MQRGPVRCGVRVVDRKLQSEVYSEICLNYRATLAIGSPPEGTYKVFGEQTFIDAGASPLS